MGLICLSFLRVLSSPQFLLLFQLGARKWQVADAKAQSERMLSNVLPTTIVQRLYENYNEQIVDFRDSASVLFVYYDTLKGDATRSGRNALELVCPFRILQKSGFLSEVR